MTRRVLIVSPHFPPVNAPDMQRVRVSLPYLVAAGWEVSVLTVADPTPAGPVEEELLATIPPEVRVVRAHCFSRNWTRWLGIGNVALRSLPFVFFAGCRLLGSRRYDVVYFSTTQFIVLPFGRIWRKLSGTPYVVDLQDPWVTDYYFRAGAPRPPGGWKYAVAHRLGRLLEGWSLRRVAHMVVVSPDYVPMLRQRYSWLAAGDFTELPFGSPDPDLARLRASLGQRRPVLASGGFRLAFAGALGPGMLGAVDALLAAVANLRRNGETMTVHFFGTSYAGTGRTNPIVSELVHRHQLQDCVHEAPARLPYFSALQVTLEADVNLLFGSTDSGFTPSKVLALLAAGRPVLAIAQAGSALAARLDSIGQPAILLQDANAGPGEVDAIAAALRTLRNNATPPPPPPEVLTAKATALRQAEIFARVAGLASA